MRQNLKYEIEAIRSHHNLKWVKLELYLHFKRDIFWGKNTEYKLLINQEHFTVGIFAMLKGKVENLKICFRHYKTKAFFLNDGGQLRLKKGKVVVQNFIFEVSDLVQSVRDLLLVFSKYRAHYIIRVIWSDFELAWFACMSAAERSTGPW